MTVTVSVQATEAFGNALHYRWAATDGVIQDTDASSTQWTLPPGPGLHFAYVLVSNGKGGYVERRMMVSTDNLNTSSAVTTPTDFDPPAKPASNQISFRGIVRAASYTSPDGQFPGVYLPDVPVYLQDSATGAKTSKVLTDLRGSYSIPDALPGVKYDRYCEMDPLLGGAALVCEPASATFKIVSGEAANDPRHGTNAGSLRDGYRGRVVLNDGKPCGIKNEFFGLESTAFVSTVDVNGNVLNGPYRTNVFGTYGLTADSNAKKIRIKCENGAGLHINVPTDPVNDTPRTVYVGSSAPTITSMSAVYNGDQVGVYLPPSTSRPSDKIEDSEFFLSAKGIDTRISACQYYLAIGAVKSCDALGRPTGAITFDDWKRKVQVEPYARNGQSDVTATFINGTDLNLTRRHHSIFYSANEMAAYVCNHLGPVADTQSNINTAIANAINNKDLIACVAMDYRAHAGVNNNNPFVRFFTFGPSGELLLSINLDGRGEKFIPGTCVACHGGDRYAGKFPTNGQPDIGSHFLPYDSGNFAFSSAGGFTELDQQHAIKLLNQNVLNSGGSNAATKALISGWYQSGGDQLNKSYLPTSWQSQSQVAQDAYLKVYARSCRTCHVALTKEMNFDDYKYINPIGADPDDGLNVVEQGGYTRSITAACTGPSSSFLREFSMPNAPRAFDLYHGSANTADDQLKFLGAFLAAQNMQCSAPLNIPAR